jgi:hypothetical protein
MVTWEDRIYSVRVEGPAGSDWLQATARTEEDAREKVEAAIMPGVRVAAVELVGEVDA